MLIHRIGRVALGPKGNVRGTGGTLESGAGLRLVPKSTCFWVQNQIAITSKSENGKDSLSSSAENSLSDEEAQLMQEIKVL